MAKPQPAKPQAKAPAPQTARFALPKSGALARALEALKRGDSPTLANVHDPFQAVVFVAGSREVQDVWPWVRPYFDKRAVSARG